MRCKVPLAIVHRMAPGTGERNSQLLRGVLDMCLLALLSDEPAYGYEVTKRLAECGLAASDGSVYPLLGRLQRQHLVVSEVVVSETGPPRKYYRTSADGLRELSAWTAQWREAAAAVDTLLKRIPEPT